MANRTVSLMFVLALGVLISVLTRAETVALDPRHTTHNIPGKFVAYMRSGLPVLARVNKGNDLRDLIHTSKVGFAVDEPSQANLQFAPLELVALSAEGLSTYAKAAKDLWAAQYSAEACAQQILARLTG